MATAKNTNASSAAASTSKNEDSIKSVPAQANPNEDNVTTLEVPKKSLKDRLKAAGESLKSHKKTVLALSVAVGAAGFALAKYAKKQAEEKLDLVLIGDEEAVAEMDEKIDEVLEKKAKAPRVKKDKPEA